jgi:hypothetical protein
VRGEQGAKQRRGSLDTVVRRPEVPPTFDAFGRHLDTVRRSYWPGLLHCDDVPGLPRTTNERASRFRDTARRLRAPTARTAYVVFAPQVATVETVVQVAGSRWTMERCCAEVQGEGGLDQ